MQRQICAADYFSMTSPACVKIHRSLAAAVRGLGLPAGARVLDAPCGEGELCLALAHHGFEVSGADILPLLEPSAAQALQGRFRIADLTQPLPWPDASFDVVVCAEGIEHLENPFAFIREAHRLCRSGGYLVVTTPNVLSLRSRVRYLGSGFFTQDPRPLNESERHPLHHIGLRTFWEWRYILHTSGFQLAEVSHTHMKPIGFAYAFLAPWTWLYTRLALRRERDPAQRRRNREIRQALGSRSLLFGDNILLVARRS